MTRHSWLAARAFIALALMIGFYVLALGIAGILLWIVYAQSAYSERVYPKLVLICLAGAATILWSIIPRIDRFKAPGPRVLEHDEPELFELLSGIASGTNQTMPREVYFINEVNAFVTQRGGVMGIGSRRVMGLGLPLMQALTVQEFKAVLAHEFGHYHSGDVALGPLIHKTRMAILRTVQTVSMDFLQKLFAVYAKLFLRVTQAVSRRQEFIADEVAAQVAGATAMTAGLRKVHGAAAAFGVYLNSEVGPVLGAGFVPPLNEGFARFISSPGISDHLKEVVKRAESEASTDPYDSHPCLKDRVAALAQLPQHGGGDSRPAIALLTKLPAWERRVLAAVSNEDWVRALKAVDWDDVVETICLPGWRKLLKQHGQHVQALRIGSLPLPQSELARIGGLLQGQGELIDRDQRIQRAIELLAAATTLALIDCGWTAESVPGEAIVLRRDGAEFSPVAHLARINAGLLQADAWRQRCADLGIAEVPLTTTSS